MTSILIFIIILLSVALLVMVIFVRKEISRNNVSRTLNLIKEEELATYREFVEKLENKMEETAEGYMKSRDGNDIYLLTGGFIIKNQVGRFYIRDMHPGDFEWIEIDHADVDNVINFMSKYKLKNNSHQN